MALKQILLASAFAAALGGVATADSTRGWYLDGTLGANWVEDDQGQGMETGWAATMALGYAFQERWRLEVEAGYRLNDFENNGFVTGDQAEALSGMLNLYYDFDVAPKWDLSLGAGIGGTRIKTDVELFGFFTAVNDSDTTAAWQLLAEASYQLNDHWSVQANYTYFAAVNPEFDTTFGSTVEGDYDAHTAMLGLRYHFGAPAAEVVDDQPTTCEQRGDCPAPIVDTYIVFFDFNKSNLSAEAQAVVAEAAATYQSTGKVNIDVVGHTDTVGSASYNQSLSERRAGAVASELVSLGVPADKIMTSGRGFADPLVPTGPGVREPQNRRAVINLQ